MFNQPYAPQTKEEFEAAVHIATRILEDGSHNVTCCPYPMRAMCKYRKVIEEMKKKGWVDPPTLQELLKADA